MPFHAFFQKPARKLYQHTLCNGVWPHEVTRQSRSEWCGWDRANAGLSDCSTQQGDDRVLTFSQVHAYSFHHCSGHT